jgi:DNA polymerase III subunit gamma/tau
MELLWHPGRRTFLTSTLIIIFERMEKFIVSARKYRPVTFDTVVGQPAITNTLKNAIRSNHLAQAFLFTGPRGVGKTTTARILAKTINCENITPNIEACNNVSCQSFNSGNSLNIYELDAASNNSVDDIRSLVDQVRYAPQMGKYKIYIIDEVHMLSTAAFNAFLKTLEEPPSYAIFILATTEKHKIIPTILSRCQIFDFNRISVDNIVLHLQHIAEKEGVDAEEDALHIIAQKADGALRDALSLFDQLVSFSGNKLAYKDVIDNLNILDYDYYFRITDDLLAGNIPNILLAFKEILDNGFDAHNFINGLASHFRDLLVCKDEVTLTLLEVSPSIRERYKVQSKFCQTPWLLSMLDLTSKADIQYKSAKNQRLHIELTLLMMCTFAGTSNTAEPVKKKVDLPLNAPVPSPPPPAPSPTASPAGTPAAPASTPPGQQRPPGSPLRKTISISEKLSGGPEKKNDIIQPEVLPDLREPFDREKLERSWIQYASRMESEGRMTIYTAMTKRMPVINDNFLITFSVDSAALERDMNEQKTFLLAFLRKELSNYSIGLTIELKPDDGTNSVPYTPSEKFQKLVEKNPALMDLKKAFDLEIDY